jgi:hypothetical protein
MGLEQAVAIRRFQDLLDERLCITKTLQVWLDIWSDLLKTVEVGTPFQPELVVLSEKVLSMVSSVS